MQTEIIKTGALFMILVISLILRESHGMKVCLGDYISKYDTREQNTPYGRLEVLQSMEHARTSKIWWVMFMQGVQIALQVYQLLLLKWQIINHGLE